MGAACSRNHDSRRTACVVTPDLGGGNGPCGVGGVFFEPEGTIVKEQWEYVGEGNGGYNKMQKYDYVGQGRGSFDRDSPGRDRQSKRCCVGVLLVLVAAAVVCVITLLQPGAIDTARESFASIAAGMISPVVSNSTETKRVSQQPIPILIMTTVSTTAAPVAPASATIAPPSVVTLQTSTPAPPPVAVRFNASEHLFSCAVGEEGDKLAAVVGAEWVATDVDKDSRVSYDELKAQRSTLSKETFDALVAADADQDGSLTRGEFAAVFAKLDTPLQTEDVEEKIASWSDAKKVWCCQHAGLGCTTTSTVTQTTVTSTTIAQQPAQQPVTIVQPSAASPAAYNCSDGVESSSSKWSLAKQAWCCTVEQKGCPEKQAPHTPAVQANCDTLCEFESMQASCKARIQWSAAHTYTGHDDSCGKALEEVIGHCPECSSCALEEADCPSATLPPPLYDCDDGLDKSETWPVAKQSWCCGKTGKGCPPDVAAPSPYECDEAKLKTWSDTESTWCCTHKNIGCSAGSEPGFNCDSGLASWSWGWSDEKKSWCCEHEKKGCATPEPAPTVA